jgi:maleamate amidohydrolase
MSESTAFRADDPAVFEHQGFGQRLGIRGRVGLLIVDFVVGFADPTLLGGGNIRSAISKTVELLALARRRAWPVAHTRIVFSDAALESDVFCLKVPSLRVLTESAAAGQFVPELQPLAGELVVRKAAPSAFFETNLRSWLTQKGVQTLLISGATTSGCVRASVVDAMSCGYRPVVMSDCVGDRAHGPHDASLFDMQQKYADLLSLSELLEGLDRPAARAG